MQELASAQTKMHTQAIVLVVAMKKKERFFAGQITHKIRLRKHTEKMVQTNP